MVLHIRKKMVLYLRNENGLVYKKTPDGSSICNSLVYKKKPDDSSMCNGLVYKKSRIRIRKWLTMAGDIFQMAISSFIFNVETRSLKR